MNPETMEKKSKGKVYISGPIAHYDLSERKTAFAKTALYLKCSEYDTVNPFDNGIHDDAPWQEHMKADMKLLLECKYIYMMPGWQLSKGCKLELDVATSCDIETINL